MWPKTRRTTDANPWIRGGSACLPPACAAALPAAGRRVAWPVCRSNGTGRRRQATPYFGHKGRTQTGWTFSTGCQTLGTEFLRFGRQVGAVVIAAAVLSGIPLYLYWGIEMVLAAAVGFGIGALNALAGGLSAIWSFDRPQSVFLKTLLGGMVLRMLVICGVLVLLIEITALSIYGLVFSLFLSYLLFQILEIRFFVRRAAVRRVSKEGV